MATTPPVAPTPPVKKVSWLKKLGLDVLKVIGVIDKVEKVAELPAEALLPASAIAFGIWDKVMALVTNVEAGAAAVGQGSNGVAKFQAVLPVVAQLLDQYVADNFPGSKEILAADTYLQARTTVSTNLTNTVVQFLNSLPANPATATTPAAVATAAAVKAISAAPNLQSAVKK